MATYLKEEEIKTLLDRLIDKFVEECRNTGQMNTNFMELIKHNFYAKFVHYNPENQMVEIGINESNVRTTGYQEIKIYNYPLSQTRQWLSNKFQYSTFDMEYYAGLIGRDQDLDTEIIVIDREDD